MKECCPTPRQVAELLDEEFDKVGRRNGEITEAAASRYGYEWAVQLLQERLGVSPQCAECMARRAGWY